MSKEGIIWIIKGATYASVFLASWKYLIMG